MRVFLEMCFFSLGLGVIVCVLVFRVFLFSWMFLVL